jgi:putative ATP-dependent endonuclease of the OLD family
MMYLQRLEISNFRCLKSAVIHFNKGLNVIIGENNSGKSAIIDSLRICLGWGQQKKDVYIGSEDFFRDKNEYSEELGPVEFHLFFKIENPEVAGVFNELLSVGDADVQELKLNFSFTLEESDGISRVKSKIWGGDNEGSSVKQEVLELFYHVYLDAMRNVEKDLWPGKGNKIGQLFANTETNKERRKALSDTAQQFTSDEDWGELIGRVKGKINDHLLKATIKNKGVDIDINFFPLDFVKIVEGLRIQSPIYKTLPSGKTQEFFEVYQNGLGFNNLIYISTVLGDLIQRKTNQSCEYSSLLIEEPEAHLQPQLQTILFNYFNTYNSDFQIFITSHSPTITAEADIDSLIILQRIDDEIKSLSVKDIGLTAENKNFLHRFLDVTRAQLFFANGVILVEGISEALLLPIFSKILGIQEDDKEKYDINKNGIEIVNINGVAFEPFAKLFNSEDYTKRLNSQCAIITDSDEQGGVISARAQKATELGAENLSVFLSDVTFEKELFSIQGNQVLIKEVYQSMHPRTEILTSDIFIEKIVSNKDKAEFAQKLAAKIEEKDRNGEVNFFTVPEYIKNAIKWACKLQ